MKVSKADLRFEVASQIRLREQLFFPLMRINKRLRGIRGVPLVSPDTELVIEGYLRCANTFAALAFVHAQSRKAKLANHTHAPASIERAVRLGIPILVLIRNPEEVAVSHVLKYPGLSLEQSLRWYWLFYDRVWPHIQSVVLADFTKVTTDFGEVIREVNCRFNTDFTPFMHTEENTSRIFERIRETDQRQNPDDVGKLSVPTELKRHAKERLRSQLCGPAMSPWLNKATEIYERFSSFAIS